MPKMREMDGVSRPLLALLLGTVVFLALWMTALKPSSSGGGSGSAGVGGYTADINAARGAVKTADAASAAHGGETAPPVGRQVAARPSNPAARQNVVLRALVARKVIVLLFYNPSGADDRAVRAELAAVPAHRGRVVKLSVPLSELALQHGDRCRFGERIADAGPDRPEACGQHGGGLRRSLRDRPARRRRPRVLIEVTRRGPGLSSAGWIAWPLSIT